MRWSYRVVRARPLSRRRAETVSIHPNSLLRLFSRPSVVRLACWLGAADNTTWHSLTPWSVLIQASPHHITRGLHASLVSGLPSTFVRSYLSRKAGVARLLSYPAIFC